MLALTLARPKFFYPLVWISLVFIFEPVNRRLGRPHFLAWLQQGDWRPVIALSLGALICGFFWEMWNYWSWPQWIYHTPGAKLSARFRNAAAGLRRLHPIRAGIVRTEKSSLGAQPQAGALKQNSQGVGELRPSKAASASNCASSVPAFSHSAFAPASRSWTSISSRLICTARPPDA